MNRLFDIDISEAAQSLAVANTPYFLLRKLKTDPAVREISERFSQDEILDGLRTALEADPTESVNAVRPYVYLAALSQKPSPEALKAATTLQADKWEWYLLIAASFLETYFSISRQTFRAEPIILSSARPTSTVPASRIVFKA
ncbi:MAG TPA: hypothetical protein VMI32_05155 [Candidatus Solibacter sp.]|nr:hypothetical protein [Candidatus Solibacter sp.]